MKCSLAFLFLSAQVLYAGLERYSDLVVADVLPAASGGGDVHVTYLGTKDSNLNQATTRCSWILIFRVLIFGGWFLVLLFSRTSIVLMTR
jgi:hypothetical protein